MAGGPRSQIVWPSDGLGGGLRERDRTAVAVGIDRPDAEEQVVVGQVDGGGGDVADRLQVCPVWRGGFPSQDLVTGQVRVGALAGNAVAPAPPGRRGR